MLVLAPLAAPGYALLYDMVFVPRQPLSWDLVAPAQSLPRAVPMDALVSLVTQLVPGWLVQRLVLGGAILLAAVGAGRLVPTERRAVRLLAAVAYAWTPYLAERLLIGQWGLLLAYAALPWLVRAALDLRAGRDGALARRGARRRARRDHPDRRADRARHGGPAGARPGRGGAGRRSRWPVSRCSTPPG